MTTAFQSNAFQNNAFQIDVGVTPSGVPGGARYRYFTPIPPPLKGKKKREIDRAIEQETRIKTALVKYETSGIDVDVLTELARKLRELQLRIMRLGLESELALQYIEWKRKEEDEDIAFILSQI